MDSRRVLAANHPRVAVVDSKHGDKMVAIHPGKRGRGQICQGLFIHLDAPRHKPDLRRDTGKTSKAGSLARGSGIAAQRIEAGQGAGRLGLAGGKK